MSLLIRKIGYSLALAGLMALPFVANASAEGDAALGEKVFRKCKACHKIGEGAKNSIGPYLNDVVGGTAGHAEGYRYGKGLLEAKEKGLVWDAETLSHYLENPQGYIAEFTGNPKAKVKMRFKLKKEEDRQNVIAYLATFSK